MDKDTKSEYAPDLDKPVMRIGAVAELLGVSEQMVRVYESRGLVRPARKNNQRLYSFNDVCWLARIRELIHEEGYDIDELRRLINLPACWMLKECPEEVREVCPIAQEPGKRCWEVTGGKYCSRDCETCQVYLVAHDDKE